MTETDEPQGAIHEWLASLPPEQRQMLREHSEEGPLPEAVVQLLRSAPFIVTTLWEESDDLGTLDLPSPIKDALTVFED